MSAGTVREAAERYVGLGYSLVRIHARDGKAPKDPGWHRRPFRPEELEPGDRIGLLAGPSGTAVLDADDLPLTLRVLEGLGIDAEELTRTAPTWSGNPERRKWLFRLPEGVRVPGVRKLVLPAVNGTGAVTVFELRGTSDPDKGVQDVLPPSIHPGTGAPYEWVSPIVPRADLPDLPEPLADVWTAWDRWTPTLLALCGVEVEERTPARDRGTGTADPETEALIAQFNAVTPVEAVLERNGYRRKGRRWLHPDSTSGTPGVLLLEPGIVFAHDGSPLADGHKHDAFDCARILENAGDWATAFRCARENLGLDHKKTRTSSRTAVPAVPAVPDDPEASNGAGSEGAEPGTAPGTAEPGTGPSGPKPPCFKTDRRGVWWHGVDRDGEPSPPLWVCSPLEVAAVLRDERGEGWGRLLTFPDLEGNPHEWGMPTELLKGSGEELRGELWRLGLRIGSSGAARAKLGDYLSQVTPTVFARSTERTGWHGTAFVTPRRTFGDDGERVLYQAESLKGATLGERGTLADWQREVAALCVGNSRLVFAVSCAFAAPLLGPAESDSGGFHLRSGSSTGKTRALKAAASVYGPTGPAGYAQTWRTTDNGLEAVAAGHSDCLLILDELGQVDPRVAGEVAYLLGNGEGKRRAGRSGFLRRPLSWRLLFLSAGEVGLADHMRAAGKTARAGQELRLAEVPGDAGAGMGLFENLHGDPTPAAFAERLKVAAEGHYGTAFPALLERLIPEIGELPELLRAGRARFLAEALPTGASGQAHRVADRFALVALAGEVATDLGITGWPEDEAWRAAVTCFRAWLAARGGAGSLEPESMLAAVRRFLELHGESRFAELTRGGALVDADRYPVRDRAGFRRAVEESTEFLVLPEVWRAEVCAGLDPKATASLLAERGALRGEKPGHLTVRERLPGLGRVRVYAIQGAALWEATP